LSAVIAKVLVPVPRIECRNITSGDCRGSAARVLEAEVQVVQERAVGMLHVEVALAHQELHQLRAHGGSGCAARAAAYSACTAWRGSGVPVGLLADPGGHHVSGRHRPPGS
jgi:hypothetical protein